MKSKIVLIIILIIASALRLWGLGTVPPSPDWDEAALGYNAYSVLQTGRDEYGELFPIVLQSFNDYKPALYMYFTVPSVAILGLDLFAVRLPSAIFGILTVLATYFLVLELIKRKDIALISALLLAISPWHLQFSRIGFEANVGLAFNVFAALFFLKGLKKPYFLLLFAACVGLSISVYQSEKVFTPLLCLLLTFVYRKELFSLPKKYIALATIVGLIVLSPVLYFFVTNDHAFARAKGVSIFSDRIFTIRGEKAKYIDAKIDHNSLGVLLHSKYVVYVKELAYGYTAHYNLNWYFYKGDLERHHAPGMGMLYLWELPFLFIGIYTLLFSKFPTKGKLIIFFWFLFAPIPAAFAEGDPHGIRTLNFLPTFQIFNAVGLVSVYAFLRKTQDAVLKTKVVQLAIFGIILCFACVNFFYYIDQYYVQQNYYYSQYWQYGYKEAVNYLQQNEKKYKKIVVSNIVPMDQSYMFFLFYMKYPPEQYQKKEDQHDAISGSFDDTHAFDKFEFRPIDWVNEKRQPGILYIGSPHDFTGVYHPIKEINYLDGKPAILMVEG